ncbi:hypothetical protein BDV93DRAFT_604742 [Ceratobasidium sp. AG-I]|nr:hypothetical protein BDV93DRAFT_604742 [Ceratobasidium sp. AG-I]
MLSVPSRIAINWSLGALKENKNLTAIRFPFGWESRIGPIFGWYEWQSCTKFISIQHRKEREFPFYHEFLCVMLTDGKCCRFERFGDPDARADAITKGGSMAYDTAEILPSDHLALLNKTSDVLEQVTFPCELDLLDVLEICYNLQRDERTRAYTLQRYNCYFFCWCILLILTRKVALWENTPSLISAQIVRQLESDLFKGATIDQHNLAFLHCRWLAPNMSRPERYVIQAICDGARDFVMKSSCYQLGLIFWGHEYLELICRELRGARNIADWAKHQTPIWEVQNQVQYSNIKTSIDTENEAPERFLGTRELLDIQVTLGEEIFVNCWNKNKYPDEEEDEEEDSNTDGDSNADKDPDPVKFLNPNVELNRKYRLVLGWATKIRGIFVKKPENTTLKPAWDDSECQEPLQQRLELLFASRIVEGAAQHNMQKLVRIVRNREEAWHNLWAQSIGELLVKHLAPLIIQSVQGQDSRLLKISCSPKKNDLESKMNVSEFQQSILARLATHASRVQRAQLGSALEIRSEVVETVKGVWVSMTKGSQNGRI